MIHLHHSPIPPASHPGTVAPSLTPPWEVPAAQINEDFPMGTEMGTQQLGGLSMKCTHQKREAEGPKIPAIL